MNADLNSLTNRELKQYISANRNDGKAFRAALEVLMSRRDPNEPTYPYGFGMNGSEDELEAVLKKKIEEASRQDRADTDAAS